MADSKISELTALTGALVATDDEFVIVDTSAVETKRITKAEFDAMNALLYATKQPAGFSVYNSVSQGIPSSWHDLDFDTEVYDTGGAFTKSPIATTAGYWTVPTGADGKYLLTGSAMTSNSVIDDGENFDLAFWYNSANIGAVRTYSSLANIALGVSITAVINVTAGDTLYMRTVVGNNDTPTIGAGLAFCNFAATYVGV
jgi:hypothetical protein